MFQSTFKLAWRNLFKNKAFSLINIVGLSVGMAACLLILQYVRFQLGFDHFNVNAPDLYRVYNDRYQDGKLIQHGTITYSAIGKAMQDDYPEVINHTRVEPQGPLILTSSNKKIGGQSGLAVDNSFLRMFTYPIMAGDAATALKDPHTIILTETLARNIFGSASEYQNMIGKAVYLGLDSTPYKITAVCKDVPENSHLDFSFLTSYITLYSGKDAWTQSDYDFTDSDFWHYVQLKHGTDYRALEAKFAAFSNRHFQGNKISGSVEKFYLQPLLKAHLYSDFEYEIGRTASATVVWGLLVIAVLIIIIACVNYINLTTAKSLERAKEVGIRKVSGATRQQLVIQFLSESSLINLIALVVALLIALLAQNGFNQLVGHPLSLAYLFQNKSGGLPISFALILLLVIGILASGFYPAFVLSSYRPIMVLKGKFTASTKGAGLRRALVIGQFAITVALIIGSFVVYKQMRFVSQQDLGMNIAQVMVVNPPELTRWDTTFIERHNSFRDELLKLPHVQCAASSWAIPGGDMGRSFNVRRVDQDESVHYTMRHTGISIGYLPLYKIKLVAGRDFTYTDFNPDFSKLKNIILNESAVKLLGFASPQDAIGKTIIRGQKWDVIGVIKDYHQKSLRYPLEPTMLFPAYSTYSPISIKVETKDLPSTIDAIKKKYNEFFPGNLFDYTFLDEHFNEQYANEKLFGKVFAIFSGLAIVIACLGLLGLSLFSTAQRTKEIGVRKVLGASISNIVLLLSKDFIRLVIIAFVIASPVIWYVMHQWLQDFAYRTTISWWIFFAAGLSSIVIALATISFQAIKAAIASPVKSLRTE